MYVNIRLQLHHTLTRSVARQDPAVSGNHVLHYSSTACSMGVHEICVSLECNVEV